jgi:hypothetical protein
VTTPPNSGRGPVLNGYSPVSRAFIDSSYETTFVSQLNGRPGQTRREAGTQSQGSLHRDRPAADLRAPSPVFGKEYQMKANLARFMQAIMLLGAMALTVGAGIRWS